MNRFKYQSARESNTYLANMGITPSLKYQYYKVSYECSVKKLLFCICNQMMDWYVIYYLSLECVIYMPSLLSLQFKWQQVIMRSSQRFRCEDTCHMCVFFNTHSIYKNLYEYMQDLLFIYMVEPTMGKQTKRK